MPDKLRRRRSVHAPHGSLPNWVLVAFAAGAVALATLAHTLV
ncbi:hypothetical protein [Piscinibacter sp.]|nr:hypothetical protein [Albitalea sp.]HUG24184.1 hypothetical protein [Albitalea sp.]